MVETPPYEVDVNNATWEEIKRIGSPTNTSVQLSRRANGNNNISMSGHTNNLGTRPAENMISKESTMTPRYNTSTPQLSQQEPTLGGYGKHANTANDGTQSSLTGTQPVNNTSTGALLANSDTRPANTGVQKAGSATQPVNNGAQPVNMGTRPAINYTNGTGTLPAVKSMSNGSRNMPTNSKSNDTVHHRTSSHTLHPNNPNRIHRLANDVTHSASNGTHSARNVISGNSAFTPNGTTPTGMIQQQTTSQPGYMNTVDRTIQPTQHIAQPINSGWSKYTAHPQMGSTPTNMIQQLDTRHDGNVNNSNRNVLSGNTGVTHSGSNGTSNDSRMSLNTSSSTATMPHQTHLTTSSTHYEGMPLHRSIQSKSANLPESMNKPKLIGKGISPKPRQPNTSQGGIAGSGNAINGNMVRSNQAPPPAPHPRVLGSIRAPLDYRTDTHGLGRAILGEPPRPVILERPVGTQSQARRDAQPYKSRVEHTRPPAMKSNTNSSSITSLHGSIYYNSSTGGTTGPPMNSIIPANPPATTDTNMWPNTVTQTHGNAAAQARYTLSNATAPQRDASSIHNGAPQRPITTERVVIDADPARDTATRASGGATTLMSSHAPMHRSVNSDLNSNATARAVVRPQGAMSAPNHTTVNNNTNGTRNTIQSSSVFGPSQSHTVPNTVQSSGVQSATHTSQAPSSAASRVAMATAGNTAAATPHTLTRTPTPTADNVAGIHNSAEYTARVWNRVAGMPATDEQIARAGLVEDVARAAAVVPSVGLTGPTRLEVYEDLKNIEGIEGLGLGLGKNGLPYSQSSPSTDTPAPVPEVFVETPHNTGNPKQLPLMPRQNSLALGEHVKTLKPDRKVLEKLPPYDEETAFYLLISAQKLAGTPWYGTVEEMSKEMERKGTLPHRYDINFNVRQYTAEEYIWRHTSDPEVAMKSLMQRIARTPNTPAVIVRKADTAKAASEEGVTSQPPSSTMAKRTGFKRMGRVLHHNSKLGSSRSMRNLRFRQSFKAYNRSDLERSTKYGEHGARWKVFGHTRPIYCCLYDRTGTRVITAGDDGNIKIWSAITGELMRTLRGHTREVVDISISSDNTTLVSACRDKVTVIWDMIKGDQLQVIHNTSGRELHNVFVSASPYPDNQYVVTIGADGTARFYKNTLGSADASYRLRVEYAEKVTMKDHLTAGDSSSGGSFFAVGSTRGESYIYHLKRGFDPVKLDELPGHKNKIGTLKFSTRGCRFATGSLDGTARVWDLKDGVWISNVLDVQAYLVCNPIGTPFATDPKTFGRKILDEANNKRAKDYMATLKPSQLLDYQQVSMVCFNCDDTMVITAVGDCTVKVWNPNTKEHIHTLVGHANIIYVLEPHPTDPSVVLSGGHDGRLILWDIIEGTCLKMIWNHDPYTMNTHGITDGRFSPDGLCIAITDSFGNVSVIAPEIRGKKVEPKEQQFDERDSRSDYPVCVVNGVVMDSQLNVPIMACPDRRVCSLAGIPYAEQLTEEEYCNYWPVQPRRAVEEYVRHGDELAKAEESNLAYQLSKRTKVSTKIVALGQQEQERKLAQSRARNSAYKREMNRRRKKEQENKVSASTAVILSTSANDRLAANRRAPPLDRSGRSPAGNGTSARRRNNTVYIDADDDTIDVDAPEVVTNAPSSSDAYHVTSSEESETDVSESDTESNFSSDLSDLEYPKATRTRGRKKIASTGKRKATSKARVGSKTGANPQPNPKYKSKKRLSRGVNGTGRGKRAVESDISDDNDTPPSSDTDSGDGSDSDFGVPNRRGRKRASSASRSKARQPSRTRRTTSRARGKRPVLSSDSESADDTNNDCDDNNNNTYNNNDKDSHNNTNANANTNGSGSGDDVIAYSDIAVKPRRGRPAQTNNPLRKNQRGAAKRRRVESYAVDGDSDASADAGEGSSQGRSKGKRARTRYTSQNSQALAGSGSDSDQGMDREVVPHRGSINSAGVGTGAGSGRAAAVGMNYREQPSVEPDSEPNASDGETGMTDSEGEGERASFGSSVPKGKGKITQTPQRKRTPVPMGRGDGREHVNGDMNIPTPEGTSHTQGGRQPRVAIKSVKAVLKGTPRSRASVSVQPYDTHHRGGRKKNGVDDDGLFASNGVQPDAGSEWWDNMPLRALVAIQPVLWNCLDAREYFGDPVNINFFPDYYSTIQNPMDLGTIRDNAKEGAYTNRPSFYIRDVCLVFNNAKAYNKIESDVYKAAQHLESVFTAHLKVLWDNHKDYIELGATDNIHANEFSQTLSDAPLSARAMEQLGLLHAELITTPHTAVHFSRPVFETLRLPGFKQKELQRYLATILKPMDLHNLGICIADGMIKNLQQYASLMELSISNCVSYNLKNSNIVEQAQLLQICYRERLKQVEKAMDESGTPKVPVQLADIRKLHAGIMTSEYASMFNVPVPQHIEGYYEKITEAMDFGSIRDALNSQTVTMNEYMSDCTLVFTNCFLFNELDSPICVTCQQLRDAWLAKCNILLYGRQSSRRRQQ